MESDTGDEHFQVPTSFDAAIDSTPGESFVDVATLRRGGITDRVLHIDDGEDQWQPVEIESPADWYKGKLAPSETVRHPGRNFFSDGGLEFEFQIWKSNDRDCCPTAGQVTGTYKVVRAQPSMVEVPEFSFRNTIVVTGNKVAQTQTSQPKAAVIPSAGTAIAGNGNKTIQIQPTRVGVPVGSDGGGANVGFVYNGQNPAITWKMIVDTGKRQTTPADAKTVEEILQ